VKGLQQVLDAWERARENREAGVLATVVRVAGSAYRRPGARMFFPAAGPPVGLVSGGCLEGDLAERAQAVLASGEPRTVVYDMRSPDDIVWGLGLGCNGEIRVLLERLDPAVDPPYLGFLRECRRERRCGVVATLFEVEGEIDAARGERIILPQARADGGVADARLREMILADSRTVLARRRSKVCSYSLENGSVEALIEHVAPAARLLVFGAGQDAVPVVRLAAELGWEVEVLDNRPAYASVEKFPGADAVRLVEFDKLNAAELVIDDDTAVVLMTHHFLHDVALLRLLLPSKAQYVGVLGPKKRTQNLLDELKHERDPVLLRRLHGPVGIDLGAEEPEEIALALLAEIQAVRTGRSGGFLRDRSGPLHDWSQ